MRLKERGLTTAALVVIVVGIVVAVVVPVTIVAVLLSGGGFSLATPEATINSFVDAFNAHDADATWNCLSNQMQNQTTKDSWDAEIQRAKNYNYQISGLQIFNVSISGDYATATGSFTVSGTSSYTGQPFSQSITDETVYFVREGGLWKLNIPITTIFGYG